MYLADQMFIVSRSRPIFGKHLCKSGKLRVSDFKLQSSLCRVLPKQIIMAPSQITATQKVFIGMDVHKKSWTVHFKTDLFDYRTISMPPSTEGLISYVQKNLPGH